MLFLVLWTIASPVLADSPKGKGGQDKGKGGQDKGKGGQDKGGNHSAPEIDLGALPGALTLLVGGTMVLADRRRRK